MLRDLAYTVIYVGDIERSILFYRDVIGIPVDYTAPGWVQFKSDGAALVLHPKLENQSITGEGRVHITFRVDDLGAVHSALTARGVQFAAPPSTVGFGKHATLFDPDGNAIDLIEWGQPNEARPVTDETIVNDILSKTPDAMQVLEEHSIRICGGCIVLLNASMREVGEFSGLSAAETAAMVDDMNKKLKGGNESGTQTHH